MSNDTAKSVRNIVAQFPVLKGTYKLVIVCSRAFIKAVCKISVKEMWGKKHPYTCDKRDTR